MHTHAHAHTCPRPPSCINQQSASARLCRSTHDVVGDKLATGVVCACVRACAHTQVACVTDTPWVINPRTVVTSTTG